MKMSQNCKKSFENYDKRYLDNGNKNIKRIKIKLYHDKQPYFDQEEVSKKKIKNMEAVEVNGIRKEIGFGHRREMNEIRKI